MNLILKITIIPFIVKGFTLFLLINGDTVFFKTAIEQPKVETNILPNKIIPKLPKKLKAETLKKIYGIDISHYRLNGLIKASQFDSISFVFIKATEGENYTNPNFYKEWNVATKNKLFKGAYHFYRDKIDPIVQADYFYSKIKHVQDTSSLPAVLDVEKMGFSSSIGDMSKQQEKVLKFLCRIEELTGRIPIVYTNVNFGKRFFTKPSFSRYPLWIADYSKKETPRMIDVWKGKGWLFWQRCNNYQIDSTKLDLDVFSGSLKDLKKLTK
jgi:lysozyme